MFAFAVRSGGRVRALALAGLLAGLSAGARAEETATAPTEPAAVAPTEPAAAANAATLPPPAGELEGRVRELEETVRQLQDTIRRLQETKPAVDPAQVRKVVDDRLKQQKPLAGWQDSFYLQSADGNFRLRVRGYTQSDFRAFTSKGGDTGNDSFFLRRARAILEGTLYKNIDFRLMPDWGGGAAVVQDAYLELKYFPAAQLRFGRFKEPLSLERLQSGQDLLFVERSITNNLAPIRDVGVQLSGDLAKGTVSYQVGAFNGVVDGGSSDGDAADDKDFVGRVVVQPLRNKNGSALQGLGLGVAGTIGRRDESVSGAVYRTAGRSAFFRYDNAVVGDGRHSRLAPQFYYYRGPFGLLGEQITSNQKVLEGTTRGDLTHRSWFVQGSYFLTGENASYRSVSPKEGFDPSQKKWGAVEVAARYAHFKADPDTFRLGFAAPAASARKANAWTFGLNWYLTRALKAQLNYERTNFTPGIRFGSDTRGQEDVFLTRLQVAF